VVYGVCREKGRATWRGKDSSAKAWAGIAAQILAWSEWLVRGRLHHATAGGGVASIEVHHDDDDSILSRIADMKRQTSSLLLLLAFVTFFSTVLAASKLSFQIPVIYLNES